MTVCAWSLMSLCSATGVPVLVEPRYRDSNTTSVLPASDAGTWNSNFTVPDSAGAVNFAHAYEPVDLPVSLSISTPETVYCWPGVNPV